MSLKQLLINEKTNKPYRSYRDSSYVFKRYDAQNKFIQPLINPDTNQPYLYEDSDQYVPKVLGGQDSKPLRDADNNYLRPRFDEIGNVLRPALKPGTNEVCFFPGTGTYIPTLDNYS